MAMKRKHEEKILAEIRNRVIEKDQQRHTEKEIQEMREANIEALTELTSLSREEVIRISEEVKRDEILKRDKRQRLIGIFSVLAIVAAIIAFFVLRPEPEINKRTVEDTFSGNLFNWQLSDKFTYDRKFENNQYVFETKTDGWCYWDGLTVELPANCDIIVGSNWISGKYSTFGFGLFKSSQNYFAFSVRGDGGVTFGKKVDSKWVIDDPVKPNIANKGAGQTNVQKVEIRNKKFTYFVNGKMVRTGDTDMEFNALNLICCGEQKVAFDYVKIVNSDNQQIVLEQDFSSPSDKWAPKKSFTYSSMIEDGKFLVKVNEDKQCYWSSSGSHQLSNNCEVELTSVWKTGDLSNYGLMVLNDDDNYYSLEIQHNGEARLVECKNGEYSFVQPFIKTKYESDGLVKITQKAIIKGDMLSYYVNDHHIKDYKTFLFFPCNIAIRSCGMQTVEFEKLTITYFEN
jgi:hypothetical protein